MVIAILLIVLFAMLCSHAALAETKGEFRWVAEMTADGVSDNLAPTNNTSSGAYQIIKVAGRKAFAADFGFLCVALSDDFLFSTETDLTAVVEYYDQDKSEFFINYDGLTRGNREPFKRTNTLILAGDKQWKTAVLKMPSAYVGNAQGASADLRLWTSTPRIPISSIKIYADGLENETYSSKEAMRRALWDLKLKKAVDGARTGTGLADKVVRLTNEAISALPDESTAVLRETSRFASDLKKRLSDKIAAAKPFNSDAESDAFISDLRKELLSLEDCLKVVEGRRSLIGAFELLRSKTPKLMWFSQPITNSSDTILPWYVPQRKNLARDVSIQACRGEFEPYSIELISNTPLKGVSVKVSDARSRDGGTIPAKNIDIRIVKHWYQAGHMDVCKASKTLVPELLLHDDSLIKTDLLNATTKCEFVDAPVDPDHLMPFDLPPLETRQLWVTVHVPEDARSGLYRGKIEITCKGIAPITLPVAIEVPSFDLAENPLISAMYFYEQPSLAKTPVEDYKKMLANMRDHGLSNPNFGIPSIPSEDFAVDMETARADLRLRKEMGVNKGPLLTFHGYEICSYLNDDSPEEVRRRRLAATIRDVNALAKEFGYTGAYLYAQDEAMGDLLASEVPVFRLVRELGGAVWVAVYPDFVKIALNDLQMPNYCGPPPAEVVDAVHKAGNRILVYSMPQGGIEDSLIYRRNYGLKLWQMGVDGACTFAYRCVFGSSAWDDFAADSPHPYRNHMMTYPGKRGPIDTIQWEGYREGCDDLRYMHTLELALAQAQNENRNSKLTSEVTAWLIQLRTKSLEDVDLHSVRKKMIDYITRLRG